MTSTGLAARLSLKMRYLVISALLFAFAASAGAASQPETLDDLKQRASAAKLGDQPRLFLDIAERQLHAATEAYKQDKVADGRVEVEEVTSYCEKAAASAITSRRYLKQAEIRMRDMIRTLEAISHTVAFEDRAPLQTAIERIEKARSNSLSALFAAKS
jgi:hypothetical protein